MTDPLPTDIHYRVKPGVSGGATVRALPQRDGAVIHRLKPGDDFWGEPVAGQLVTVDGMGHSHIWIRDSHMGCVWLGFLEQVKEGR